VLGLVGQAYVDQPDTAAHIAGALHGATDALDPFSIYLPPAAVAGDRDTRALGWAHSGLGLLEERGIAYVVAAEKGSPADQAGVQPGDIVAAMNARSTRTMPAWEIRRLLAGPPGTRLDLELIRIGGELHKASLVLAPFQPPPPSLSTVDGAPVLRLATFDATTARAVERLLAGTAAVTSGGLVVDLRGTSAGDPAAAYATAGVFAAGDLGSLARRQQELRAFTGDKAPVWHGRLVVLVDRGTLGAAEVLATVLRQKAGAELVGERTFGYAARGGSVELATGGRLLYSEAFYSGPDRKPLNEALQADVKVDERSRTYLEKDVPITELILKRGVQRLLASVEAARKVA